MSTNISTNDPLVGRVLADKYGIEGVIRVDEYGTIYRGKHLLMDLPVTVKVLSPILAIDEYVVERFSEEARSISRLSHPNILNVTDFGKDADGSVFLVMEEFEGESITELIAREGPLDVDRAVLIAKKIAGALSAAHSTGMFHSGLTSSKVLVSRVPNGQDLVKVLDIGSLTADLKAAGVAGRSLEDLAYCSPEQCSGESVGQARTDIYSLGIILYELLTGEVPFKADTATDLMMKHVEVPPPPLVAFRSDVPETIEPILLNALAKNPDRRYQSAAALADDLSEAIKVDGEDDTVVIPNVGSGSKNGGNDIWKTAFIVLAGVSVLALSMYWVTGTRRNNPLTALPVDAGSQPVQPLNPATGVNEQGNLMTLPPGALDQADNTLSGDDVGGGDGYDPWANPGAPRPGGRLPDAQIGPGGDIYTIPGDGSIFMPGQDGSTVILVPKYIPEDSPTPDTDGSPKPSKSPAGTTPTPSKSPKPGPAKSPVVKPSENPSKDDPPAKATPPSQEDGLKTGV